MSTYKYKPQSVEDERRPLTLPVRELTADWLGRTLAELEADEELAFHSRVRTAAGQQLHIPLIDFAGEVNREKLSLVRKVLGTELAGSLSLYRSGRSFHGYILKLLTADQWIRFMGSLLLLNLPDRHAVTDSRWVGHRLIAGYAALRWSHNTRHYLSPPTLVDDIVPAE